MIDADKANDPASVIAAKWRINILFLPKAGGPVLYFDLAGWQ
jgi:hypothetical protein